MENIYFYIIVAFVGLFYFYWTRSSRNKQKSLVGYIKEIRIHPVKSAMPIVLDSVEVTDLGLSHDRQFALLNQYGTFVTLRRYPKFVLIKQTILGAKIKLEAPGMADLCLPLYMTKNDGDHLTDVTIWKITTTGVHVSKEADEWFSKYLCLEGSKLYSFPIDGIPRHPRDKGQWEVKSPNYDNSKNTMMFTDGSPVMITSEASLEHLNKQYGVEELDMDRFRPNIVVTGCPPYAEDGFGLIQIGDNVTMDGIYPCERCIAINILSKKGEMSKNDLLQYLNRNRSGPKFSAYSHKLKGGLFGFNYGVRAHGTIKVGDPIYKIAQ